VALQLERDAISLVTPVRKDQHPPHEK